MTGSSEGAELRRPLPEPVRQRVVGLAAEVLGTVPAADLPPGLRRFARFAPARRAKLAATPLAAALESDPAFRRRVADLSAQRLPDLTSALTAGTPPPAADPVDLAVVAYLVRPVGWPKLVGDVADDLERAAVAAAEDRDTEAVERLQTQLSAARAAAREERDRLRAEVRTLKSENAGLRQRLRQARDRAEAAEGRAAEADERASAAETDARAARAEDGPELRKLRSRLAAAEETIEALRRAGRQGRDQTGTRLKLLLETLVDAADGLRRELALPNADARPADSVDAVEPAAGRGPDGNHGASLETLLTLPRAHLIVDGYNVTKTAWPAQPLAAQRSRLVGALGGWVSRTRAEVTVVFDGAALDVPPPVSAPRGVRVRFSPAGVTADDVIRRLVEAEPPGRPVVVVSSDREIVDAVRRAGARSVPASELASRLG